MANVVALQPRGARIELRRQSMAWLSEALQFADALQRLVDEYDRLESVAEDVADDLEIGRDLRDLTQETGLHAGAEVLEWIAKTAAGLMPAVSSSLELRAQVGQSIAPESRH